MSEMIPGTAAEQAAVPAPAAPADLAATAPEPPGPEPLGVARTATGSTEVDTALERLADADGLPVDGHLEVYEDAHGRIRAALEDLDRRPGPPAPGAVRG
ncbi:hypothetical protein ACFQLX_14710 [Streptomyces polyrhachis]|uniref:Uncharacterized protein n=1 Tax=Streptomyces polyrhachis TaxID=1282885 RepID=A0ABW2GJT8_9ACTN